MYVCVYLCIYKHPYLTITTNQIPKIDTQNIKRKEYRHKTKESHQITGKKGRKKRKRTATTRNQSTKCQ